MSSRVGFFRNVWRIAPVVGSLACFSPSTALCASNDQRPTRPVTQSTLGELWRKEARTTAVPANVPALSSRRGPVANASSSSPCVVCGKTGFKGEHGLHMHMVQKHVTHTTEALAVLKELQAAKAIAQVRTRIYVYI
jgi:hypothetical protein